MQQKKDSPRTSSRAISEKESKNRAFLAQPEILDEKHKSSSLDELEQKTPSLRIFSQESPRTSSWAIEENFSSEPFVHEILEESISKPPVYEESTRMNNPHQLTEQKTPISMMEMLEKHKSRSQRMIAHLTDEKQVLGHRSAQESSGPRTRSWAIEENFYHAPSLCMIEEHKSRSQRMIQDKAVASVVSGSANSRIPLPCERKVQRGNLSLDELLNATFVNKNDKKNKLFDKEALENLHAQEILIGAFTGSYKRVKLEEFEENLDDEDICSVFEIYVKGVKQKEDETLDIYREKLIKLKDYKP